MTPKNAGHRRSHACDGSTVCSDVLDVTGELCRLLETLSIHLIVLDDRFSHFTRGGECLVVRVTILDHKVLDEELKRSAKLYIECVDTDKFSR